MLTRFVVAGYRPHPGRRTRGRRRERHRLGDGLPGAIDVPSGRLVVAANAPPNGGFDFSTVTAVPPVFVIVKLLVAVVPTRVEPKSIAWLENWRSPGVPAEADRPTLTSPPVLSRPIVYLSGVNVPAVVGSNEMSTVMLSPGAIVVLTGGASGAENGALGCSTPWIVSVWSPTLLKTTEPLR